jgi:hypothetical protein
LLFCKNCNMAICSTAGTTEAMCGYGNIHYDYIRDYLCHVTQTVV